MLPNKRNTHHEKPKDKNEEWLLLAGTPVYSSDDPEEPKVKTDHKEKPHAFEQAFPSWLVQGPKYEKREEITPLPYLGTVQTSSPLCRIVIA